MEYQSFYSQQALGLYKWSTEERNRVKASKINEIAQKIELKFRKHRHIGSNGWIRGNVVTLPSPGGLRPSRPVNQRGVKQHVITTTTYGKSNIKN